MEDSQQSTLDQHGATMAEENKQGEQPLLFYEENNGYQSSSFEDFDIELIQIEKQKKLIQLEILELEEKQRKIRNASPVSRGASRSYKELNVAQSPGSFAPNQSRHRIDFNQESSDYQAQQRGQSRFQTINYEESRAESFAPQLEIPQRQEEISQHQLIMPIVEKPMTFDYKKPFNVIQNKIASAPQQNVTDSNTVLIEPMNQVSEWIEKTKKVKKSMKKKKMIQVHETISAINEKQQNENVDENGRVPPPPQPAAFIAGNLKAKAAANNNQQQMMMAAAGGGDGSDSDDDKPKNFFEPISYSKLMRIIATYHPYDMENKQRYSIKDRVTIKDYEAKLSDACFCYALGQNIKKTTKFLKNKFKGEKIKKFSRPESMADLPDSNSSEDSDGDDNAITNCSQSLGDGATLYLQMMKTFTIMFFLLTILNIPLFILYENNTDGNEILKIGKLFRYFTIGNLGQLTKRCGWGDFAFKFMEENYGLTQQIEVDCGTGYVNEVQQFGFLYTIDKLYGGDSDGQATCDHVENPMAPYKKPPPVIIICNEDEMETDEFLHCEINRKESIGEITKEEAIAQRNDLKRNLQEDTSLDETVSEDTPTQDTSASEDSETQTPEDSTNSETQTPKDPTNSETVPEENQEDHEEDTVEQDPYSMPWHRPKDLKVPEEVDTEQLIVSPNIDPTCLYDPKIHKKKPSKLFMNRKAQQMFDKYYEETCFFKSSCKFDFRNVGYKVGQLDDDGLEITQDRAGLFGLISDECKLRMSDPAYLAITSKLYIGILGCKYDDVQLPFGSKRLHKERIGIIIVVLDFSSILLMMYFFAKINALNNEFLEKIDDLRVQMKDFGVKINNVKLDKYTLDSRIVKIKIWLHFKDILELKKEKYNDMQCIDVCLSLYTQPSIQCVFRMQEIQLEINSINNKLFSGAYKEDVIPDKQEELKVLLEKQKRFEVRYKQLVQQKVPKDPNNLTVTRVPKSQKIKEIQYIFVVFKHCETKKVVLDMYERASPVGWINSCMGGASKEDKQQQLLFGRELDIEPILEPDEIIWENLAFTGDEQKARRIAINVFSVFFLVFNTLFTMYLSGFSGFMNRKIPDAVGCPDVEITKKEAFQDYLKGIDDDLAENPTGLMGCYCMENTSIFLPWTIATHNFVEFSDLNKYEGGGPDNKNYCMRWWSLQYLKDLCLFFVSTSAVFINEIVADCYQKLGQYQKKHTKIEEQTTCFRQIFTQEYINMGIIVLLTSFDSLGIQEKLLGELATNSKVYSGFEPNWYMDSGNKICIMIFMSSFLVNSKDVIKFVKSAALRIYDRRFKMNMKLDPEDEDCDLPNTRIRIQSDLEKLYTGIGFKGEKAYSRMMSTMFVIQMYSSGMPILYFNGFIFYLVTYSVNKFLLINYYQKSRTLTRTIPLFTMEYLRYGLLLHLFAACFMLTNPIAFQSKDRSQGVHPMYSPGERLAGYDAFMNGEEDGGLLRNLGKRFQYFHQQLYFTLLIGLIMTQFVGFSTYKLIYFLVIRGFKVVLKIMESSYEYAKEKTKQLLVQREREKARMVNSLQVQIQESLEEQRIKVLEKEFDENMNDSKFHQHHNDVFKNRLNNLTDKKELQKMKEEYVEKKLAEMEAERQKQLELQQRAEEMDSQYDENGEKIDPMILVQLEEKKKQEAKVRRELQKKRMERPDYSDNIIMEFSTDNLSNFYERSKRELHDFWEFFQYNKLIDDELLCPNSTSPYRTLFLETLYTIRVSVEDCVAYQEFLLKRIKDIEIIIDKYFKMLQPTLIKRMKDNFDKDRNRRKKEGKEGTLKDQVQQRKYEEWYVKHSDAVQFDNEKYYSYKKKMRILVDLQEEVIQADKNRKENRESIQDICRMSGSLSQSYFIFDAQQYKVGRKIYFGMDLEEENQQEEDDDFGEQKPVNTKDQDHEHGQSQCSEDSEASKRTYKHSLASQSNMGSMSKSKSKTSVSVMSALPSKLGGRDKSKIIPK